MHAVAGELGLDVVVEVAEEEEIELVLDLLDPDSFLVQNHLEDRRFDLERTFSLLEEVPAGKAVLSEGGIQTRDEVLALERAGVDAAILGDSVPSWDCATRSRSCAATRANSAVDPLVP